MAQVRQKKLEDMASGLTPEQYLKHCEYVRCLHEFFEIIEEVKKELNTR